MTILNSKDAFMKKNKQLTIALSAFALTSLILLIVFYVSGVYPFGDRALLKWDMELQYADFFRWWHRVLHGQASMFYSFSKSLGDNTFGLTAYYLSSPFNLLLYFTDDIPFFITLVTLLKMASAALTCSIFLSCYPFSLAYGWNLILSVSYGLMGYNLCQASNIMWLDGVIWLPVIMLGIWKLISSGKTLLLYFSVIISIISNWYTAYMICLFSFFFFTYEVLKQNDFHFLQTIKQQFRLFIQYCITMIAGVLTTMFFFFPVIRNLLQGKGVDTSGGWIIGFHAGIRDILKGSFVLTVPYTGQGLTFFCGSVVLLSMIGYFLFSKRKYKERIWSLGYLIFLIFCTVFIPLENIWNGFRKVASYYCRFSFVVSFFIIYLAAVFLSSFVINRRKLNCVFVTGCCIFTCAELFYGSYQTFAGGYGGSAAAFNQYASEEQRAVTAIQDNEAQTFYRTDQTSSWRTNAQHFFGNFNEGMAYGFMPLSSYSSTYNRSIMYFYNRSGYSSCNRLITWCEPILTSDTLLGIKYVLGDIAALGYTQNDSENYNGKSVYTNPYALELGYRVSDSIQDSIKADNTFEYQNVLLSRIVGHDVQCYKPCSSVKEANESGYSWKVSSPQMNSIIYGYCAPVQGNDLELYIDGNLRTYYSQWSSYKTFQVGTNDAAEHTVELRGTVNRDNIDGTFYYLDLAEFQDVIDEISQHQVHTTELKDGYVKCEYTADESEQLLLTVPYDCGWQIYVNGQKTDAHKLQHIFTGIDVSAGKNVIEMKFRLPGYKKGILFSICGILLYSVSLIFFNRLNLYRRSEKE